MFDKAYIGLASQDFEQCYNDEADSCLYSDNNGHHCAWGWVDLSLGNEIINTTVKDLNEIGIGIAATLDEEQLLFATKLQIVHDNYSCPFVMRCYFNRLAREYNLTIPKIERKKEKCITTI